MTITINRKPVDADGLCPSTLAALLEREGLGKPGQAVAVDNRVVSRALWPDTPLRDGMKVTVITAVCGG